MSGTARWSMNDPGTWTARCRGSPPHAPRRPRQAGPGPKPLISRTHLPKGHGCRGHGDVEQVVGDDGAHAHDEHQLPAVVRDGAVDQLPLAPLAAQRRLHPVPEQVSGQQEGQRLADRAAHPHRQQALPEPAARGINRRGGEWLPKADRVCWGQARELGIHPCRAGRGAPLRSNTMPRTLKATPVHQFRGPVGAAPPRHAPKHEARAHDEQDAGEEERNHSDVHAQEDAPASPVVPGLEPAQDAPKHRKALRQAGRPSGSGGGVGGSGGQAPTRGVGRVRAWRRLIACEKERKPRGHADCARPRRGSRGSRTLTEMMTMRAMITPKITNLYQLDSRNRSVALAYDLLVSSGPSGLEPSAAGCEDKGREGSKRGMRGGASSEVSGGTGVSPTARVDRPASPAPAGTEPPTSSSDLMSMPLLGRRRADSSSANDCEDRWGPRSSGPVPSVSFLFEPFHANSPRSFGAES